MCFCTPVCHQLTHLFENSINLLPNHKPAQVCNLNWKTVLWMTKEIVKGEKLNCTSAFRQTGVWKYVRVTKKKFSAMSIIVYLPLDNHFVLSDRRKVLFIKFFTKLGWYRTRIYWIGKIEQVKISNNFYFNLKNSNNNKKIAVFYLLNFVCRQAPIKEVHS